MAELKYINDLPEQTGAPDDAEVFVIQGNETKKIPWGKIKEYVGSGIPVIEKTMAEYKNLSDEEKNKEVFYLITDLDSFNAYNIDYDEKQSVGEKLDSLEEWIELSQADVFYSIESALTLSTFEGYRRGKRVFVKLGFTGTATTSASGSFKIGSVNTEFCPKVAQSLPITLNVASSGQVYGTGHGVIYASGALWVYTGGSSKTYGTASYPWCTNDGLYLSWDIV